MIVFDCDARICIVHQCEKYTGIGPAEQYLKNQVQQIEWGATEHLVSWYW